MNQHALACFSHVRRPFQGLVLQSTGRLLQATRPWASCTHGRYMAEISDDMDRTRATTAAKAAYEDVEES